MKKISLIAVLGVMVFGGANAEFVANVPTGQKGGFVDGTENIVTVRQVREMRDDVPVIVKGKIIQRMGDEKYLFEDSTGSITVEIDDETWRGQTITPADDVKLQGDVDAGIFKTELDIDYIEKLQ